MGVLRRVLTTEPRWVTGLFAALFVVGSIVFFVAERPAHGGGPQYRIGTDGRYYWAYLTSLVLDGDLDFGDEYADPESGNYFRYERTSTGAWANPFSIGPAILWLPFFLVAHGAALIFRPERWADGTSYLHQGVTLYGSFVYAFAAGLLAYALVRRRYGPAAALAGTLVAWLGGSVVHYALHQPYYSHAPSAFAVAAVLFVWDRGRDERGVRGWLLLGALIGLAALVRAQNVVFAAPAVVEGIAGAVRALRRHGARAAARAAGPPLLGAAVAVIVFVPQMVAWKVLYGAYLGVPQGAAYMRWTESLWAETLFASRNGLFPWAPLWAVAILGLVPVTRRDVWLGVTLWGTFAVTAYLNGAADDWSGGGAFGGRRYDGMVVHVALGFAAVTQLVVEVVLRRPRLAAGLAIGGVVATLVTCNLILAHDFRAGRLTSSTPRDTVALYDSALDRAGRWLWSGGNPLSWPAAWAFALRTGAPPSRYDLVVGSSFLTDTRLELYRKPDPKLRDELRFGAAAHERFLVRGFAEPVRGGAPGRPARREARVIVPLHHAGGVAIRLVGRSEGATGVRVRWNGERVAEVALAPHTPIDVAVELSAAAVRRGVNILDLEHDGAAGDEIVAAYDRLILEER